MNNDFNFGIKKTLDVIEPEERIINLEELEEGHNRFEQKKKKYKYLSAFLICIIATSVSGITAGAAVFIQNEIVSTERGNYVNTNSEIAEMSDDEMDVIICEDDAFFGDIEEVIDEQHFIPEEGIAENDKLISWAMVIDASKFEIKDVRPNLEFKEWDSHKMYISDAEESVFEVSEHYKDDGRTVNLESYYFANVISKSSSYPGETIKEEYFETNKGFKYLIKENKTLNGEVIFATVSLEKAVFDYSFIGYSYEEVKTILNQIEYVDDNITFEECIKTFYPEEKE